MKKLEILGLVLLGILFFVWPVGHTVTARDVLLILNFALFGYFAWVRGGLGTVLRELSVPALVLAGLTAWIYFVAFFISPETAWSLNEISSQWWRALAVVLVGALVAIAAYENPKLTSGVLVVLLVTLVAHILYVDFQAARGLLAPGPLDRIAGLTEGPDKSNYLTNVLFGFLLVEVFFRAVYRKRVLPLSNTVLAAVLVLTAVSVFAERTRNGMITLALMLLLLGWFYLRERHERLNKLALSAGISVMMLIVLGGVALVVTARQSSSLTELIDTIPIALDTEHYKAWQDEAPKNWPKLPNGETVDISLYQRIAWLKEGLLLVRDHPLGIGFGRDAFGHGLKAKYGQGTGHSHSGLLDLGIGTGIPGVLLWLGFFASLMYLAWKRFCTAQNYAAILLMLIMLDYGVRMLLDSVIRDHMFQQFMFLTGLAAVMMVAEGTAERKPAS